MSSYGAMAGWSPAMPTAATTEVRLTRRGRLLRSLALVALACGVVVVGVDRITGDPVLATTAPMAAVVTVEVIVEEGDSLWNIAQAQVPQRDPRTVVRDIRELNGLRSNLIQPGQVLLVPSVR